jgi:hypothetical protein
LIVLLTVVAACVTPVRQPSNAAGGSSSVRLVEQGDQRCIESNGVPDHAVERFPNRGNPHRMRSQRLQFCFDAAPRRSATPHYGAPVVGIALNGIPIRPGTAEWYDPAAPRGFSRDRSSGWNFEGMGNARMLGMDRNNAHVDHRGLYHYHGVPAGLLQGRTSSHIGYAADGFEIHYAGSGARSSYRLKAGNRPTAPGGPYDGRFVQDWEYIAGSGDLDECNGGMLDGRFVYFATDTYPFYPRCHWGRVGRDFRRP